MKKQTPENSVKDAVKKYLYYKGWFSFPILQGLGAHKGISDRIAVKTNITLFIECKGPKGKQTPDQIRFGNTIIYHGGPHLHYIVVKKILDLIEYVEGLEPDEENT